MADFAFKQFVIHQDRCAMKVGTDGVLLGSWAAGGRRILDIGTGTGLIALMMAQRFPAACLTAIDIEHDACVQARLNVMCSAFTGIDVQEVSLQDFTRRWRADSKANELALKYDSIVSNPPFFVNALKSNDEKRTMARHNDSLSYRDLFCCAAELLADGGVFSVVIPADCLASFISESYVYGLFLHRKYAVRTVTHQPPKRYLLSFSNLPPVAEDVREVYLMDEKGERSAWYAEMTRAFYVK